MMSANRAATAAPMAHGHQVIWVLWFLVPIALFSATGAAGDTQLGLAVTGIVIATAVFLTVILVLVDPLAFLTFWFGLLFWQNAALGVWGRLTETPASLALVSTSTLLMYVAAAVSLFTSQRTRLRTFGWPVALLLAAVATSGIGTDPTPLLGYLRGFTMGGATAFVAVHTTLRVGWPLARKWLTTTSTLTVTFLSVGVLGQLVYGTDDWLELLGLPFLPHLGTVSVSTTVFGERVPRIASLIVDPVNTAFIAAAAAIVSSVAARRLTPTTLVGAVIVVLSAGKGAMLMLLLAAALGAMPSLQRKITDRPGRWMSAALAAVIALGIAYIAAVLGTSTAIRLVTDPHAGLGQGESTTYHVAAFVAAFTQSLSHPWGHGLGIGGNLSVTAGTPAVDLASTGGESGLGVLVYQLGWLGLLAMLLGTARILKRLNSPASLPGVVLLVVWLCSCVYQEQVLGPLSSGLIFIAVGAFFGAGLSDARIEAAHDRGSEPTKHPQRLLK